MTDQPRAEKVVCVLNGCDDEATDEVAGHRLCGPHAQAALAMQVRTIFRIGPNEMFGSLGEGAA